MAVEGATRVLLDQLAASGFPGFANMTVAQAREALLQLRELAGPPAAIPVEDLSIPGVAGSLEARIYRPRAAGAQPVLVYFHGGGFVCGNLDGLDSPLRALAGASGCAIISVAYRLAPEHPFPAAHDDAWAATCWVADHRSQLGLTGGPLAVGGDSCGANLAVATAIRARDDGGPAIALQLLLYPMLDPSCSRPSQSEFGEGFFVTRADLLWFWSHYLQGAESAGDGRARPLDARLGDLAPALVVTAEFDPLRDEGEELAERLRAAGVPTELIRYEGLIHACFQMAGVVDRCRAVVADLAGALRRHLGAVPAPVTASRRGSRPR